MTAAEAFAPAKINLTLHVTGQRHDGYHLLDSLVEFADIGDSITVQEADRLELCVTGPMAPDAPDGEDNLVLRAARLAGVRTALITLTKRLPTAAGIGGGSSDAAATLRALQRSHGAVIPPTDALMELGADVPICLAARSLRMRGVGERIDPVPAIPPLPAVLVNPGLPLHTPDVFRLLSNRNGVQMPEVPEFFCIRDCTLWLAQQRNDLEEPALRLCPPIRECLAALQGLGALLARMSGSGASCFGLFETQDAAEAACARLRLAQPAWWVQATILGGTTPQIRRDTT